MRRVGRRDWHVRAMRGPSVVTNPERGGRNSFGSRPPVKPCGHHVGASVTLPAPNAPSQWRTSSRVVQPERGHAVRYRRPRQGRSRGILPMPIHPVHLVPAQLDSSRFCTDLPHFIGAAYCRASIRAGAVDMSDDAEYASDSGDNRACNRALPKGGVVPNWLA